MLDFFKRLFGARRPKVLPGEARGAEVLEFIGVNAIIHSWALRRREGLDGLWETCPRADWLVEIAHRAGLPLARLERAVRSLPLELEANEWTSADALLADLGHALDRVVDKDPELVERTEAARIAMGRRSSGGLSDEDYAVHGRAEELHTALHARHTDAVRAEIPYRELRDALWGQPAAGPYR